MKNQVSRNIKYAFSLDIPRKNSTKKPKKKEKIEILSFEVARIIYKAIHLHKSLTDDEFTGLTNYILKKEGVKNLVSDDDSYLLELVLAEKLNDLNAVANVVSRLGKKCMDPALLGFEHIYADILCGKVDAKELGFLMKDIEVMIKKMERYANLTSKLSNGLEVLNELEQSAKKIQIIHNEESRKVLEQKISCHRQDIKHLRNVSLWNQTYDKILGILARIVCTIFARLFGIFTDSGFTLGEENSSPPENHGRYYSGLNPKLHSRQINSHENQSESIGTNENRAGSLPHRREISNTFNHEAFKFPCGLDPGRLFMECLTPRSSVSLLDNDKDSMENGTKNCKFSSLISEIILNGMKRNHLPASFSSGILNPYFPFSGNFVLPRYPRSRIKFILKNKLLCCALPSTIGGSALALHYANVVIVIEKFLSYPHLVWEDARDDLYQMLPTSLRNRLRTKLKSYFKNLSIYDAPLAHEWKETIDKILQWLSPMAQNMIRWQTERSFEQQRIITGTNVLLLQTLYFADRGKTEDVICELLVGLNYICRYEHQQNALLDYSTSSDLDDCDMNDN